MRIGPTTNSLVVALAIGIMGSALAVSFLYADWPIKARVFDANGNAAGGVAKQKLKRKDGALVVTPILVAEGDYRWLADVDGECVVRRHKAAQCSCVAARGS
jgi:hypothetical protein